VQSNYNTLQNPFFVPLPNDKPTMAPPGGAMP